MTTITIAQGKITGKTEQSILSGRSYTAYYGIPYAKPPVGDLRFKAPEKADGWSDVYHATTEKPVCPQKSLFTHDIIGEEDSLYLNVYVPEKSADDSKAVMVHIYGGGFVIGSSMTSHTSPDYFMDYDVILVTFNYRLNVLGFLNLGIPDCPGNAGLKDQVFLLKWVQENIEYFGGNPNNVTIFGESAGGASVHYHMLSPASDGLFHKCILHSGDALCTFSFCDDPDEIALEYSELLGFKSTDKYDILRFLKTVPFEKLIRGVYELKCRHRKNNPGHPSIHPFKPSAEVIKEDAFLIDHPRNLLNNTKKVPVIYGLNDYDGSIIFVKEPEIFKILKNDFKDVIQKSLKLNDEIAEPVAEKIQAFYFQGKTVDYGMVNEVADLYTDLNFSNPYECFESLMKGNVPVYVHKFSYEGTMSLMKGTIFKRYPRTLNAGTIHGDECAYLFFYRFLSFFNKEFKLDENDVKVIKNLINMWTNFAKTGNPNGKPVNVDWVPISTDRYSYLQIDKTLAVRKGKLNEKRIKFWQDLREYIKSAR